MPGQEPKYELTGRLEPGEGTRLSADKVVEGTPENHVQQVKEIYFRKGALKGTRLKISEVAFVSYADRKPLAIFVTRKDEVKKSDWQSMRQAVIDAINNHRDYSAKVKTDDTILVGLKSEREPQE